MDIYYINFYLQSQIKEKDEYGLNKKLSDFPIEVAKIKKKNLAKK